MNVYLISLILGIVEGLTEFLPISSTAHLKIVMQPLLGKDANTPFWDMYTVVIQLGAILALPVFFWGRIKKFCHTFPRGERGDRNVLNHPVSLVAIAFVITAGAMFLLTNAHLVAKVGHALHLVGPEVQKVSIEKNMDSLWVIGAALIIGGVIMWVVDATFTKPRTLIMEQMTLAQSVWIGLCQILSGVFPGTSRSMATIAAGQTAGMSRASALEFSFFLSMPTMAAATLYKLYKWLRPKDEFGHHVPHPPVSTQQWLVVAIGLVVSFIVALGVVAWFMGWVRKRGFAPFAIYRIIAGALVLFYARRLSGG